VLAVGAHGRPRTARGVGLGQPDLSSRDDDAGGEPLDVPLPGCGECLVEIVDVEDDTPLGRGEAAEIGQMRVTAGLDSDAGNRVVARSAAMTAAEPR